MAALLNSTQFFPKISHTYLFPPKTKGCLLHAVVYLQTSESSVMLGKLCGLGDLIWDYGNGAFYSHPVWFLRPPKLASGRLEF